MPVRVSNKLRDCETEGLADDDSVCDMVGNTSGIDVTVGVDVDAAEDEGDDDCDNNCVTATGKDDVAD